MTKIEHNKCLINLISECQCKNVKENSNRNLQCVTLLIHYDQVRFISGKQGGSNFGKLNLLLHVKRSKEIYDHLHKCLRDIFTKLNIVLI